MQLHRRTRNTTALVPTPGSQLLHINLPSFLDQLHQILLPAIADILARFVAGPELAVRAATRPQLAGQREHHKSRDGTEQLHRVQMFGEWKQDENERHTKPDRQALELAKAKSRRRLVDV